MFFSHILAGAASWGLKVKAPRGHSITLIALDGANVVPTPAKGFVFTPGERVDFILHANQVCLLLLLLAEGGWVGGEYSPH